MSRNVKWLIDKHIITDTRYENLGDIVKSLGYDVEMSSHIPFSFGSAADQDSSEGCTVVYGTVEFTKRRPAIGRYATFQNYKVSSYIPNLVSVCPRDFVNGNQTILPYRLFKLYIDRLFRTHGRTLFVRPDRGDKLFTGLLIDESNFHSETNCLESLHSVSHDDLVVISGYRQIVEEYRVIICDREIVGSSLYQIRGKHVESEGAPNKVLELAEAVAEDAWQPDPVYTCDVAIMADGAVNIIELNSFSCAGMYAANVENVVTKVSDLTARLYYDDHCFV